MKIEFISSLLNQPPNKTFLITNNKVISYNEFLELVSKTISFLEKSNKKYVFINAEKNEFTLAAYLAAAKLGKISAFIDPLSKHPKSMLNFLVVMVSIFLMTIIKKLSNVNSNQF